MRVLVIDDEPDVLEEIVHAIQSAPAPDGDRYIVEGESNVRKAIQRMERELFELVITDMRMGPTEEEGLDVLAALARKSAVAIVLTRYASIANCVKAMRAGAWDYIEKSQENGDPYERLLDSMKAAYFHCRKHLQRGRPNPS